MSGNMQSKEDGSLQLAACNFATRVCQLRRSTEAAPSNDCYYIYRLGHYNKISKYLVIIQFESYYKSHCIRATLESSNRLWQLPIFLLLLLIFPLLLWVPFIGYLEATRLLTGSVPATVTKGIANMTNMSHEKKSNMVARTQYNRGGQDTQDDTLTIASFTAFQFPQLQMCCIRLMKRLSLTICFDPSGLSHILPPAVKECSH